MTENRGQMAEGRIYKNLTSAILPTLKWRWRNETHRSYDSTP